MKYCMCMQKKKLTCVYYEKINRIGNKIHERIEREM